MPDNLGPIPSVLIWWQLVQFCVNNTCPLAIETESKVLPFSLFFAKENVVIWKKNKKKAVFFI
jgi:hypothetical protein